MGLSANKAPPVVSSRLEFARARADMHARMRSVESWGLLLGTIAVCIGMVSVASWLDGAGLLSVPVAAIIALACGLAPVGVLVAVAAYLRHLRARTVVRCVHCGAPLLGQDAGNLLAQRGEDARSDQVWRTGRCPDCRGRLFEIPEPSGWKAAARRPAPLRAAAAPAVLRPRPARTFTVAPTDEPPAEPQAPWTDREFRLRVERCEEEVRDEVFSTIAWLVVLTFIIWYELHQARTAVVVMGLISAGLALVSRVVACVRVLRASAERWALLCPGCGSALTLRRARQVFAAGRCPKCRTAIIDNSPATRARAAVPSERVQLAGSLSRFFLMKAAIVGGLFSAVLPPFPALDDLTGAVVEGPTTRRTQCTRGFCRYYVRVPVRHGGATGNIYVAERRLRPADLERVRRLQPGETIDAWVDFEREAAQLDLDGRRLLAYDRWIKAHTRRWMVYAVPYFIAAVIASIALPFRAVRRTGRLALPMSKGGVRARAG